MKVIDHRFGGWRLKQFQRPRDWGVESNVANLRVVPRGGADAKIVLPNARDVHRVESEGSGERIHNDNVRADVEAVERGRVWAHHGVAEIRVMWHVVGVSRDHIVSAST